MKKIMLGLGLAVVLVSANVVDAQTLSVGSTGAEVVKLQTWLINNGYPIPLIESGVANKGYFGVQTSDAVKMYQEEKGVSLTGVIDSEGYGNAVRLGAMTGPNVQFRSFFNAGLTQGGISATSSTAATYTTVAKDFASAPSVIRWTPNVNTTVSLSATSTNIYVPNVGDVAKVRLLNASSTAAASITFAAVDANSDLQFTEATGGDLVLTGLDWMDITIIRQSTYKVTFLLNEFTEAD